jgi:hypothetical protein
VNGSYNIQWLNPASGTFVLTASWAGNATYKAASNTTTLSSLPLTNQNVFFVESNSTVYSLAFNSTSLELSFTVSGPSGTTGYVKVTIAKSLVANGEDIKVYLDGNQLNYSETSTPNSWQLVFNYSHSTHNIAVDFNTNLIPEFRSPIIPVSLILLTIVAAVLQKTKLQHIRKQKITT